MKLYGVPLSVHTRKVQLGLRAKGIDHDLQVVIPIMPDTLPQNWDRLSPTGLIPVIEEDGFTLPDSSAILHYLDARYPDHPLYPSDPVDLGRAVWIEAYLGGFFREAMHPLFHQRVVAPMGGGEPDATVIEHVLTDVAPRYFATLDGEADGDWLVGDAFSVADISVGANLVLFHYLGETISPSQYPALSAWFRRLLAMPVFERQLEAEEPFAQQMGLPRIELAA